MCVCVCVCVEGGGSEGVNMNILRKLLALILGTNYTSSNSEGYQVGGGGGGGGGGVQNLELS